MNILRRSAFPIIGIVAPLLIIIMGCVFEVHNAWFYVGAILWLGFGVVLLSSLE